MVLTPSLFIWVLKTFHPSVNKYDPPEKKPETAIAIIEQGSTGFQRTFTGTIDSIVEIVTREQIANPAMIVIGEVVNLSEKLSWFSEKTKDKEFA